MGKPLSKILAIILLVALTIPFTYAIPSGPTVTYTPSHVSIHHPVTLTTNSSKVVVFDESKNTYRDHAKLSKFIDYLNNTLNRTVIINTGPITMGLVASADIIIIPCPKAAYSEDEINALNRFVENGGALLVMGEVADYFDPSYLNPITENYGISRLDVSVHDDTNNSYRSYTPIIHVFNTNDSVVQELANNVTDVYYNAGTALNVTSSDVVVVATGDEDTYVTPSKYNDTALPAPKGTDVVVMAYYVYPNEFEGRIFAIGSSGRLYDKYSYFDHNKPFVKNLMSRLAQAHKNRVPSIMVTSTISSDVITYHDNVTLKITVESTGSDTATNVKLKIEVPSGLEIVSGDSEYSIGDMAPGDTFSVELVLRAVYTMEGDIVVNATGSNVSPVVQKIHVKIIPALKITAAAKPTALNINERNDFYLEVNMTNISMHNVTDVSIDLELPTGISGEDENDTIEVIPVNSTVTVRFSLTVESPGIYQIKVIVKSEDAMPYPYTINVAFIATTKPNLIVLDLGHTNRPPADQVTQFVGLLKTFGTVIINNGTITPDLLSATKLYILVYPKYGLTASEIEAIKSYVANGGSLIITGNAARYSNAEANEAINAIASAYGVYFMDVTVMDETNNSFKPYTPIIHVFNTNDPVGNYLFNGVEYIYYQAGTALTIKSGDVVPLAFGDEDTYLVDKNGTVLTNVTGTDIVTMAYRHGTGKIFFIGSCGRFRDKYDYFATNSPFIQNLISRLLAAPKITMSVSVSNTSVNVEDKIYLNIQIQNTGLDSAEIEVGISVEDGLEILNASAPVENATIHTDYVFKVTVGPGETKNVVVVLKALEAGNRTIRVYYAIGGEITLAKEVTINVTSTEGATTAGGKTKRIAIGIAIAVIVAILLAYLLIFRKQQA